MNIAATSQSTYSVSQAAYYARLQNATVRSWIKGSFNRDQDSDELGFHEFVQLLAVRDLRQRGISLAKIRATMDYVREDCGIEYPFASNRHVTYTENKDLYIHIEGEAGFFTATGKHQLQLNFPPIVEFYMTQLSFDENGLANKYKPFQHEGQAITLAPDEYYGQPIISGSPYTPFALANAVACEGGIEAAAAIYKVDKAKIIAALAYLDYLSVKPNNAREAA